MVLIQSCLRLKQKVLWSVLIVIVVILSLSIHMVAKAYEAPPYGYDGSTVGAFQGYISWRYASYPLNVGSIVPYKSEYGQYIHSEDMKWNSKYERRPDAPVTWTDAVGHFPDGNAYRILSYTVTDRDEDNGFMLVAWDVDPSKNDVPAWVRTMDGNAVYVKYRLTQYATSIPRYTDFITTTSGKSWRIAHLNQVLQFSGGRIQHYGGNSGVQYQVVSADRMKHAFSITPTPRPTSVLTLDQTKVEPGKPLMIKRAASLYTFTHEHDYDSQKHFEAVWVTGPNGFRRNVVGEGPGYPIPGYQDGGAIPRIGGGSGNPSTPKTYDASNDSFKQQSFDTTGLAEGTYTVHYALYDGYARPSRSGTDGIITRTFRVANPRVPQSSGNAFLTPNPEGVLQADKRDAERFDVALGIPSSEHLYGNVFTEDYLYSYKFQQKLDTVKTVVTVTKTYNLSWTGGSRTETRTENVTVEYPVSWWEIEHLELYKVHGARLYNYTVPADGLQILTIAAAYEFKYRVKHSTNQNDHITTKPPETYSVSESQDISTTDITAPAVPSEDFRSIAEAALAASGQNVVKVRNDALMVKDVILMDDTETVNDGPKPADSFPAPVEIHRNALFREGWQIPPTLPNKGNTPTDGAVWYQRVPESVQPQSANPLRFDFASNEVTVHTPVVNAPTISDDYTFNQKTAPLPRSSHKSLILDHTFTVTIPTYGTHNNYPNYGTRDYSAYTAQRQVLFPFDVYLEDGRPIQAGTWIAIPPGRQSYTFGLPVWVDEQAYTVSTRTIAINTPASFTYETGRNANLANHVATNTINVDVVGRLFDFKVTDVADYNWQYVFRRSDGRTPLYTSYWVGDRDRDGRPRNAWQPSYMLPIATGSNPLSGYQNVAVKTGYHFKFDLMTMGNMFGPTDGVRVTPTFSFVDKNLRNRRDVDLYYHDPDAGKYFIRIGSNEDTRKRYVLFNEPLRNVPAADITATEANTYTPNRAQYRRNVEKKSTTWVGYSDWMLLAHPLRTFHGPTSGVPSWVNVHRAQASVQKWWGEYSVPSDVYIVDKRGLSPAQYVDTYKNGLDESAPIFLRDGYLIVNFNIETIRNGNTSAPHLQYIRTGFPEANEWAREGFSARFYDQPRYGDVLFYHGDLSSRTDFDASQTH